MSKVIVVCPEYEALQNLLECAMDVQLSAYRVGDGGDVEVEKFRLETFRSAVATYEFERQLAKQVRKAAR